MVYAYGLDGFAREHVMPYNPILFLPTPGWWVLPSPCSFCFCHFSLSDLVTSPSFFKLQPTIQELEELVWLARNLKLEVANYLRYLYNTRGTAHPSDGDDDDEDSGNEEDSEATPNYQPRMRRHHWLPAVKTYMHTTHSCFLFPLANIWI